jgi:hypothetical protein
MDGLRGAIREAMTEAFGPPPPKTRHQREKREPESDAFVDFAGSVRRISETVVAGLADYAEQPLVGWHLGHCRLALIKIQQFANELEARKKNAA